MAGWIKIHREIKETNFYSNPNALALWVHLLVNAEREKKELHHNNQIIQIMPGSFTTTRRKLALETGIAESNIERTLNRWQIEQRVDQCSYGNFRLITIKNWNRYQGSGQESDEKWTGNGQQVTHYKENKEEINNNQKEINKEKVSDTSDPAYKALVGLCTMRGLEVDLPSTRYLEMREEFTSKIGAAWWPQVQACVNWCYDHGKKKFTISRLRNWMDKQVAWNKEKEIKMRQEFQDKKIAQIKKPLTASEIPLWTPPL